MDFSQELSVHYVLTYLKHKVWIGLIASVSQVLKISYLIISITENLIFTVWVEVPIKIVSIPLCISKKRLTGQNKTNIFGLLSSLIQSTN